MITKQLYFLLALLISTSAFSQTFEGKIVYSNTYNSKMPKVSSDQLTTMMGATQEYYIKQGDYKSISNGAMFQWQLYNNAANKLYSKMANSTTLFWNDGSTNPDGVTNAVVNKAVTEILGYKCDELVLTCKSGVQRYYFNSKFAVDATLFSKHLYGNWYAFVSNSRALPLKSIIENSQFKLESVATSVQEMKLEDAFFALPPNATLMKSPF